MEIDRDSPFWSKVDVGHPCGCWQWTGSRASNGYGYATRGAKRPLVHRLAYELLVGEIPGGLQLDHLCRNRTCVNPDHLEPVTAKVNLHRGYGPTRSNSEKTHCIRGHAFTSDNTYLNKRRNRACRLCLQMHDRARKRPSNGQTRQAARDRTRRYRQRQKEQSLGN